MNLPLPIRVALWPLSLLYGVAARVRAVVYEKGYLKRRLNAPVISVGNLTVGGTGKSPMVLYLAEKFLREGKRVGILTRGYRGESGTSDEVEMLRQRLGDRVVFGVGADRYAQGSRIERELKVDVFLLDDGFQHQQLHRDVDIVLWDGSKKFGRQWLLPAGTLREPMAAISRADILVITRKSGAPSNDGGHEGSALVVCAQTKLLGFRKSGGGDALLSTEIVGQERFFAFCGVGNPAAFWADLERWDLNIVGTMSFRDHHRYSVEDAARLTEGAHWGEATAFVTTEKDEQNLRDVDFGEWHVYIAVIAMEPNPQDQFDAEIARLLIARRSGAA
ncbi:MAG TPA: tetraacyldisaccharide 4'-kinase [Candidatus Acidoferrum sp.]|nr:tetraacyldisaccharide 4'-kinase [Candidatus Acidoferrum sp.]